jgi:hypothetical protein
MDPVALNLSMLVDFLLAEAAKNPHGRHLQPVELDHEHLRMTGIGLTAGSELPPHDNPGEAALQVLRGHVRLVTLSTAGSEARSLDLTAGLLGRIPGGRHRIEALERSALLLTALPPAPLAHPRRALPRRLVLPRSGWNHHRASRTPIACPAPPFVRNSRDSPGRGAAARDGGKPCAFLPQLRNA